MSYCAHPLGEVPACTRALSKHLIKGESRRFAVLSEQLDELFREFSTTLEKSYPNRGQWGIHPFRTIALLLLQAMEGATDRKAAEMTRLNVGWKLVLRLSMTDEGFDDSVLSKARDRFLETDALVVLLDAFLEMAREKGYLSVVKQRVDATHIVGCVRSLNRTELILETVRNVLEELADEAPEFAKEICQSHWLERYYLSRPFNYRLPKKENSLIKIATESGRDGFYILEMIDGAASSLNRKLNQLKSVIILRAVLEEQFDNGGKGGPKFRESKDLKPSADRIISPYECEARAATKGSTSWSGYKVHLTETCEKSYPNLITSVVTTISTLGDSECLPTIIERLVQRNLQPNKLYTDAAYVNVTVLSEAKREHGINVMARLANGHSWQSKADKGFDQDSFRINWRQGYATCPANQKSAGWKTASDGGINVTFSKAQCGTCPFKEDCTKGESRILHLKPEPVWKHMRTMKSRQETSAFKDSCTIRAGVEGTQAEFVRLAGRQSKVRGLKKTHQRNLLTALAMNISRLFQWMEKKQKSPTRRGKFQALIAC